MLSYVRKNCSIHEAKKVEINWFVQASGKKMSFGEVQKLCHNSRPKKSDQSLSELDFHKM